MNYRLTSMAWLVLVTGCTMCDHPSTPTVAPAPRASADNRDLQALRDLGLTPEDILQMVRHELAERQSALVGAVQPAAAATNAVTPPASESVSSPSGPPPQAAGAGVAPDPIAPRAAVAGQEESTSESVIVDAPVVRDVVEFREVLAPYGCWVNLPPYGEVWQPVVTVVSVDWRPYCHSGRWVWTDCGWYWESSYSWGWAAFHYGRWCYTAAYRWVWVPDIAWAPAWVTWQSTTACFGWAPMPPTAYYGQVWAVQAVAPCYTYVPRAQFTDCNVSVAVVTPPPAVEIYNSTTVINNPPATHDTGTIDAGTVNSAPSQEEVERAAHRRLSVAKVVRRRPSNSPAIANTPRPAPGVGAFAASRASAASRVDAWQGPVAATGGEASSKPVASDTRPAVLGRVSRPVAPASAPVASAGVPPVTPRAAEAGSPAWNANAAGRPAEHGAAPLGLTDRRPVQSAAAVFPLREASRATDMPFAQPGKDRSVAARELPSQDRDLSAVVLRTPSPAPVAGSPNSVRRTVPVVASRIVEQPAREKPAPAPVVPPAPARVLRNEYPTASPPPPSVASAPPAVQTVPPGARVSAPAQRLLSPSIGRALDLVNGEKDTGPNDRTSPENGSRILGRRATSER